MSHTVTGIDLGAHAVKFVLIEVGFRTSRLHSTFEEVVPTGDAPLAERQAEALRAGVARLPSENMIFFALPGEMLAVRALDLPFSDPRKIEQVVGYELEGQIVHALQDVVFDHVVLRPRGEGSTVLAAAGRIDEVGDFLAGVTAQGADPRSLFVAPVVYQSLFSTTRASSSPGAPCQMLVDVGHRRTNVCFLLHGEAVYARTITRAGEALTAAVAQAFRCTLAQAEEAKHQEGFVASAGVPVSGAIAQRMDVVMREALTPLLRELRQTLASFRSREKAPVESILLTGGSAALGGLPEYLEEELGLPVSIYGPDLGLRVADEPEEVPAQGRFTLAAAIAWAGARGQKELDLRRGPFQYRASFSVIRQRAAHLALLAVALIACAIIDATMAMASLNKQKDQLQARLKTATTELFGEPRTDAKAVATLLKKGFKDEMAPLPKATAYELLGEISRRMPAKDKIQLDVTDIDIRPKKTVIRGTVDSAASVDEIVTKLKEMECFEEITKGPITEVSGGAKQFILNINSKCP